MLSRRARCRQVRGRGFVGDTHMASSDPNAVALGLFLQ